MFISPGHSLEYSPVVSPRDLLDDADKLRHVGLLEQLRTDPNFLTMV